MLLAACANQVAPTGGPKDLTPPKVTEAIPANHGVGFQGHQIDLTFDEFVTLDNANQNVLFSPPLLKKPDIKLKNKTVTIRLKEELKPNTTYTVNFGNAIKDYREGNLFKDYLYTFSTGEVLDTLSLSGTVVDSETKKAVEGMFVSLYRDSDSVFDQPILRLPDFITRTDKEGKFRFEGLPEDCFLVFAIKDVNSNRFYDLPNEMVAFLDTLVPVDTSTLKNPVALTLYAFTEVDTSQMLLEQKLIEDGLLRFVFRQPAHEVVISTDTTPDDSGFRFVDLWSDNRDTLYRYFTPGLRDSLAIRILYDTLINIDRRFALQPKGQRLAAKPFKIGTNVRNGFLLPDDTLLLRFAEPITEIRWHDSSVLVSDTLVIAQGGDTVHPLEFSPSDETGLTFRLLNPIGDGPYALRITDSVFHSLRGHTNDSLSLTFQRATPQDLGAIMVTVVPPPHRQVVVQLLNSRNQVVRTSLVTEPQRVEFLQLIPEKYSLRAIIDTDGDGRWSPGNFHRRFLPENVVDYPDPFDVKAGWDIDLDTPWSLR